MKTTFKRIKDFKPCESGWKKLLKYHNPKSFDEEISIREILKSNGINDAIWALRAVEDRKSVMLFSADIAESVLHIYEKAYPLDMRIRECIKATRLFAKGKISKEDFKAKREAVDTAAAEADVAAAAAYDAAAAAYAAEAAAYAAAYAADTEAYAAAYAYAYDAAAYAYAYAADVVCKENEIERLLLKHS